MSDLEAYLRTRATASDRFLEGDVQPLLDVSAARDPATIFGPAGTVVVGAAAVNATNAAGAARFGGFERNDLEVVDSGSDGDLAYWVGVQRSLVRVAGEDEPVPFDLRLTELYRRVDGRWELFHRHADPLREVPPS